MQARENETQISDDEDETNYRSKDVEKDLKCVTNGIEKKKSVEMLSERQRIKRGKVSLMTDFRSQSLTFTMMKYSITESLFNG